MVDRATANSSPRTATGHKQGDQTAKTKPPAGAARGFWIRAWGQREPAHQGTGRSNDPARWPDVRSRVGWTFPVPHAKCNSLRIEHPIRTLTYCTWSLTGRIGIFVFHAKTRSLNNDPLPVMHQPVDQGRCQGVVLIK